MLSTSSSIPNSDGSRACSATSGHLDTRTAAMEVGHALHDAGGAGCDLLLVFCSYHHTSAVADAVEMLRGTLAPRHVIGCTAESILGDDQELDGIAGLTAMCITMPGARLHPFSGTPSAPLPISRPDELPHRVGLSEDARAILMLADPFSTPITRLLPALNALAPEQEPVPVLGGMASGASQPGHNRLVLDDRIFDAGVVGITISGDVDIEFIVSQGCRPVGEPLVITAAEQNMITGLGGRPARAVLDEVAMEVAREDRSLLQGGILVGSVLDEYKHRFGRGDFLVRSILGMPKDADGFIVGEQPTPGQTIQFHVRDAKTAHEDLHLLLDAQQLQDRPFAAMLVTCNGRGHRLFGHAGHDLSIVRQRLDAPPVAGFFAAGELGPIGGRNHLNGHTVALTLFRQRNHLPA
ncbi:MAG: FIST N-terminal domain-containing protein [Planctomycetota bacterium]|nr:FIST N-terminal domain-containing protein [Planctomycetota bacterium]